MLRSDNSFSNNWNDFPETKIFLILKYQIAALAWETYYNRKMYNEEVTDKLQFFEDKKSNVNLIKESPENNLT